MYLAEIQSPRFFSASVLWLSIGDGEEGCAIGWQWEEVEAGGEEGAEWVALAARRPSLPGAERPTFCARAEVQVPRSGPPLLHLPHHTNLPPGLTR